VTSLTIQGEIVMRTRFAAALALPALLLALLACGDSAGPDGGDDGILAGTVRSAGAAAALEGATISVGGRQATSDANGRYELTGLAAGTVTAQVARPGYQDATATVTITAGTTTQDFTLAEREVYTSGNYAMYVPAGAGDLRAVIITLGGPVTSGFVTGDRIAPQDKPLLEESLQSVGAGLRALAASRRVALLGAKVVLEDGTGSDVALLGAITAFAAQSGHPELADAPFLAFGISAGAREGSGLVSRAPGRAIGLLGWHPAGVSVLADPAAMAVPTLLVQAESDGTTYPTVPAAFTDNRSRGALWALVVEPGISHDDATSAATATVMAWISEVLNLRLPAAAGDPLVGLAQEAGWLGNQSTFEIAAWAAYPGDRSAASWLSSQATAQAWQALGTLEPETMAGRSP
jgi:hypothetical protein